MMTKKDYKQMAEIFKLHKPINKRSSFYSPFWAMVRDFASLFEEDNPRFVRGRFIEAVESEDE